MIDVWRPREIFIEDDPNSVLIEENEKLKKYLRKLQKENTDLKERLKICTEETQNFTNRSICVTSCATQTETKRTVYNVRTVSSSATARTSDPKNLKEDHKFNQLMLQYSELLKRHEKEVKSNLNYVDNIASLTRQVTDLERKLSNAEMAVSNSNREEMDRKSKQAKALSCKSTNEFDALRKENEKLRKERELLKLELGGLDQNFFDEIEDIKFALHQSTQLNSKYEKVLRKVCNQFGVPFPQITANG